MSPPNPTTDVSANFRRRFTSVNRAREPYDAIGIVSEMHLKRIVIGYTQVICCDYDTVFKL